MEKIITFSKKIIEQRFFRYFIVGGTTFALDFCLLVLLHGIFDINVLIAATISYWTSVVFNFSINHLWTFKDNSGTIGKNVTLYLALLICNYLFSVGFIWLATNIGVHYAIAKIIATAVQVAWTYFIYKKVVFR